MSIRTFIDVGMIVREQVSDEGRSLSLGEAQVLAMSLLDGDGLGSDGIMHVLGLLDEAGERVFPKSAETRAYLRNFIDMHSTFHPNRQRGL